MADRDTLFSEEGYPLSFHFDEPVASVFDDMARRSIPAYDSVTHLTAQMALHHAQPGTKLIDIGCSTGNFLIDVAQRDKAKDLLLEGIDSSQAMLAHAQSKAESAGVGQRISWSNEDMMTTSFDGASVVVASYTLQFVPLVKRRSLLHRMAEQLLPGGVFLLVEKVRPEPSIEGLYTQLYEEFKQQQGYSELEIARKRQSLEAVLVPLRYEANVALLREAGFTHVSPFHQWLSFVAWIADTGGR